MLFASLSPPSNFINIYDALKEFTLKGTLGGSASKIFSFDIS
jgi:hypothetical protein